LWGFWSKKVDRLLSLGATSLILIAVASLREVSGCVAQRGGERMHRCALTSSNRWYKVLPSALLEALVPVALMLGHIVPCAGMTDSKRADQRAYKGEGAPKQHDTVGAAMQKGNRNAVPQRADVSRAHDDTLGPRKKPCPWQVTRPGQPARVRRSVCANDCTGDN
jgi:hypothetical protein